MKAQSLSDLLRQGDRVAVSNVTGREAAKVSFASQLYCNNVVGGWALGKGGQTFRSVEVLRALEAAEGEVSNGMKSYTYTVLNTLGEDGFLTKVGRGKWTLG